MYRCDNPKCRAEFEEPATYKEYHTEVDGNPFEMLPCCPMCGCEDYSEIGEAPEKRERYLSREDFQAMKKELDQIMNKYGFGIDYLSVKEWAKAHGEMKFSEADNES